MSDYFAHLKTTIQASSYVADYQLNVDEKTEGVFLILGKIDFKDGSTLNFKEFVEITEEGVDKYGVDKYKYGYNYRYHTNVIFRYDNALDPTARNLKSFPNHKHLENGQIIESEEMDLAYVLKEIERIILLKTD